MNLHQWSSHLEETARSSTRMDTRLDLHSFTHSINNICHEGRVLKALILSFSIVRLQFERKNKLQANTIQYLQHIAFIADHRENVSYSSFIGCYISHGLIPTSTLFIHMKNICRNFPENTPCTIIWAEIRVCAIERSQHILATIFTSTQWNESSPMVFNHR